MKQGGFGWLAKVLKRSMIKVLNKLTCKDEEPNGDFANLPTLVLWMIKDRLDYPNNHCFASVCRGWRDATLSYSKDVGLCNNESPPWLMVRDLKRHGRCKFISTTTGKMYSLFNPDLYYTGILFTKQGWFLGGTEMWKWDTNTCEPNCRLLLLNPFTKKKIELPPGGFWNLKDCRGAFTLVDGKPDLVAFAGKTGSDIRLWTIRVVSTDQNSLWTENTFEIPSSLCFNPRSVVIIGRNIYIVSRVSKLLVFDLSSCEWVISGRHSLWTADEYIDPNKGLLWKTCPTADAAELFRLNDNCREWEKFKVEGLVKKCWFVTPRTWIVNCHVASKDIDGAIFCKLANVLSEELDRRNSLFKRRYLERQKIAYLHEDDPNTVIEIIMYTIRFGEWVDMPSN
ncbi:hypothetical protein POM88_047382 [Heracleum sosnowskyi]|uniref:KIB1-4 beta-propeller domain-containing protein n=1 Tax=Heracleum sosnowskyi TaxID=360622 RepID=A0AAD8GT49_9APIA|nr:hypothetical protein POM88_047381 [Heracleum sosnowskyi]KAK1354126.1 hypothetical protein POM88_047382 [Heracleum sosnowskyi]